MADTTYNKNFAPLPIADLLDGEHHFVIPSFQRGYRWEEKQVLDLLEDIKQFAADETPDSNSYFLQPVVVKATTYKGQKAWEVLDGQQRLTTMLLVLKRLMRRLGEDEREMYEENLYDITYTNRPQLDFDNPQAIDNIDSYYLAEAKRVIDDWFKEQIKQKQNLNPFTASLLYDDKRQVKIIWYAIDENSEDLVSINIFNRLNKGKISLTSSELIKALFIMDYSKQQNEERANQLSMEWNEMERRFQDDSFWYFVSSKGNNAETRIDLLFDFVTACNPEEADSDYSYREFQRLYDHCQSNERTGSNTPFDAPWAKDKGICSMEDAWREVRRTYDRLIAWHDDNLYYHYVGYLVAIGYTPLQVYNHIAWAKQLHKAVPGAREWTIDDTVLALRCLMMERFKKGNGFLTKEEIDEIEYGSDFVSRILLLFNVESCRRGQNTRFPFDKFKTGNWDVEHVDSQNNATIQEYEDRLRWLDNVRFILNLEQTPRAKELAGLAKQLHDDFAEKGKVSEKEYKDFYLTINKYYSREGEEKEEEVDLANKKKDALSNLTLLDSATNREYKDAPYAYKRYCIVERDREGRRFIPLCTRNLFLKYYTNSNIHSSFLDTLRWNSQDREGYLNAIHEAVDPIFDSVINEDKEETK